LQKQSIKQQNSKDVVFTTSSDINEKNSSSSRNNKSFSPKVKTKNEETYDELNTVTSAAECSSLTFTNDLMNSKEMLPAQYATLAQMEDILNSKDDALNTTSVFKLSVRVFKTHVKQPDGNLKRCWIFILLNHFAEIEQSLTYSRPFFNVKTRRSTTIPLLWGFLYYAVSVDRQLLPL